MDATKKNKNIFEKVNVKVVKNGSFGYYLCKGNSRDLSLVDPSISFLFPSGSLPL
jgi:hypothetical protein